MIEVSAFVWCFSFCCFCFLSCCLWWCGSVTFKFLLF